MDKAESFVFYRSFFETAQLIEDEHDRMRLYEGLIHFGLEGEKPELPYPLNAILEQMTASVKAASDRYAAAKENGEKGGRPKKFIPPEEWQAYRKEHSQKETAEHFGISVDTLQRWEKAAKPQNQNINKNKNSNINSHTNIDISNSIKEKKAGTPEALKGAPAPRSNIQAGLPGYEWVRDGVRYRITEDSEVEELGPV